jgi:hypothetical protein
MRHHPATYLGISGTALVMLCFAVALEVSAEAHPGTESAAPRTFDTVNRTLKGDRLRVIVRPAGARPFDVQQPVPARPQMTDGCESAFGPVAPATIAHMAQRCVT